MMANRGHHLRALGRVGVHSESLAGSMFAAGVELGWQPHSDFALPGTGATSEALLLPSYYCVSLASFLCQFFSLCILLVCLKFFLEWGEYKYRTPFIPVTYQFCRVKLYPS